MAYPSELNLDLLVCNTQACLYNHPGQIRGQPPPGGTVEDAESQAGSVRNTPGAAVVVVIVLVISTVVLGTCGKSNRRRRKSYNLQRDRDSVLLWRT